MGEIQNAICLMPLLYFQTTRKFHRSPGRFDLGNDTVIRKISATEIQGIQQQRGSKEYPLDNFDVERINYTLERKITLNTRNSVNETIGNFKNLVLSMRLFKQGAVGYKAAFTLLDGRPYIVQDFSVEPRHASVIPILKYAEGKSTSPFALLTLNENELAEYASFSKIVSKLGGQEKSWPVSIRYFSRMYESKPYESALVDCMISFEALVFKGETRIREKKIPIALAIAMLIGKNSKERENVKTTLKRAYDIRNDVVHGKHPDKTPIELAELCWEAEDYLRRSIRRLIFEELPVEVDN